MIKRISAVLPPSRAARRACAGAAAGCLAVLLSACSSSSSPQAAPTVTGSSTPSAPSSGAAPTSATPAAPPATPTSELPSSPNPPCPTRYLQVKVGLTQGTLGHTMVVIDFTNIAHGVSCTLYGYPGISLAGGHPVSQIGPAAAENSTTPRRLVTLAPGQTANALLSIADAGDFSKSKCDPVSADFLQIFPPNQTTPVYLAFKQEACAKTGLLITDVVIPGSGGST